MFRTEDMQHYFATAQEAQEYAKTHPGCIITRANSYEMMLQKHTPQSITKHLERSIVAQDEAKKEIALALYYHYLRSNYKNAHPIQTSAPVMLIGPTGSGKTFIVKEACEYLGMLFIHVDTSSMVSEGIVGYNVGKLAADIVKKANFKRYAAEHCVVFFDEMDKLFHPDDDEYGSEVSHQLLRFIEGTTVNIPKQDMDGQEEYRLDTHRMQFILAGAFQWIIDQKQKRVSDSMGFLQEKSSPQYNKALKAITLEDLYKEDVPKELLGRMQSIINLYPLTEEDYYTILAQSDKSPLKEFIAKVEFHGDSVIIEDRVIRAVAKYAANSDLGVRSIRQILKKLFNEALFLAPERGNNTHYINYNEEDFNG